MSLARKLLCTVSLTALVGVGLPGTAHAGLVGSESVAQQSAHPDAHGAPGAAKARARIEAFLARDDVRRALVGQGVDAEAARARVQALTDAQAQELAGRIDTAPAGGDILGLIFTVFIILLVTDILGLTKVFPFTRPIR